MTVGATLDIGHILCITDNLNTGTLEAALLVSLNKIQRHGRVGSHGLIRPNDAHLLPIMNLVTSFIA